MTTAVAGMKPVTVTILDTVHTFQADHGRAPSYKEISTATGCGRSTVTQALGVLEARGYLRRPGYGCKPGAVLTLTDKPWAVAR